LSEAPLYIVGWTRKAEEDKTDHIDARVLARYGERIQPPVRELPDEQSRGPHQRRSGHAFSSRVREWLTIVSLSDQEYFKVEASSTLGIAGGAIYDALLGHCALKAKAQTIYTWNMKDFLRLGEAIADRVKAPPT
jgi:predicted nucleic acid-binding protein